MMSKIIQRLLVFFLGIPAVISLVYVFTDHNHIVLHFVIITVSIIAAIETYNILAARLSTQPKFFVVLMTALLPLSSTIEALLELNQEIVTDTFVLVFSIIVTYEVFSKKSIKDNFTSSLINITTSIFTVVYSGLFFSYISRMTVWENSKELLSVFFLMVFACDSLAWTFGVLLGKNNRGHIKASPNKSIAGFIGGFLGSILAGLLGFYVFPQVFGTSPVKIVLLGFLTALAAIVGDLVESVMKRSSGLKDSGSIIPGRGGILDSIDSILLAAPVYYTVITIMYL